MPAALTGAWRRRGAAPMAAVDLDPQAIVDGAFFLYLRGARDYSGGRVAAESPDISAAAG